MKTKNQTKDQVGDLMMISPTFKTFQSLSTQRLQLMSKSSHSTYWGRSLSVLNHTAVSRPLTDHVLTQDREGGIRDALISLAPLDWEKRTSRQLIEIYIECETLQLREAPDASYSTTVRTALTDTFLHLGVQPDKEALDKAVDIILTPRLRSDAVDTIHMLHKRGYTLVGIPSLDPDTFAQYFEPHIPPELTIDIPHSAWASPHAQNPALLPGLLKRSQCDDPDIKPAQILIVTTGPFRMVEPACTAGFPIVLLQTASGLESKVILDTATPTLIIENLSSLCNALDEAELSNPSIAPANRPSHLFPPYRVCNHYQVTCTIGSGSFSS